MSSQMHRCKMQNPTAIRVGHVEVEDLWMDIETRNPMSEAEVILKSGMTPRDGSRVRCFRMDGTLVSGDINPGTTVIIGSRTPSKHRIGRIANCPKCAEQVDVPDDQNIHATCPSCLMEFNILRMHHLKVLWSRQMDSKRMYGSGPIGKGQIIHIPGVKEDEVVTAIEVARHSRMNGTTHASGYRIRGPRVPYEPGDIGIVQSTGPSRLMLFDPDTQKASIEVRILENSLEATRREELERGKRHFWKIKVLSFDESDRTVIASVERNYTWRGRNRRRFTSEGIILSP